MDSAFGSLRGSFKILTSRPFFKVEPQVDLFLVACALHNYILNGGEDEVIPSKEEWTPQWPSSESSARE